MMRTLSSAQSYLTISRTLTGALDGVRWAPRAEAIETASGRTIILREPLVQILKGAFSSPGVPAFDAVLFVVHHLFGSEKPAPWIEPLRTAWASARKSPNRYAHLGALIGDICGDWPGPVSPPDWQQLENDISVWSLSSRPFPIEAVDHPPWDPKDLETVIARALSSRQAKDLEYRLRYGQAAAPESKKLVESLEPLTDRLAALLRMAWKSERLAGAAALVPWLDGALTWPARAPETDALNLGGYAEIVTKGDPSRLLPSQLALEKDEFVRRFTAGELLFFEKEKPLRPTRPERILVLDQGARTWGPVRLALAGAALTLILRQGKSGQSLTLRTTGAPMIWDLACHPPASVTEALEGADASFRPFAALEEVLALPPKGNGPREILVLTHGRTLEEPGLARLARKGKGGDRVMALGVRESGEASLVEWTPTIQLTHKRFRIDMGLAQKAQPLGKPVPSLAQSSSPGAWTGPGEPVVFPCRQGVMAPWTDMAFSADGGWLVGVGVKANHAILQGWDWTAGQLEVLPQPQGLVWNPEANFTPCFAVLGVQDGVAVCATLLTDQDRRQGKKGVLAAIHYRRFRRDFRVIPFCPREDPNLQWISYPDLHCLILKKRTAILGCDLAQERPTVQTEGPACPPRLIEAFRRVKEGQWVGPTLPIVTAKVMPRPGEVSHCRLEIQGDSLMVQGGPTPWELFQPKRDGLPLLPLGDWEQAVLAGNTLVLKGRLAYGRRCLFAFEGPKGSVLWETPVNGKPNRSAIAMPPRGDLIAQSDPRLGCQIRRTHAPGPIVAQIQPLPFPKIVDFGIQWNPLAIYAVLSKNKSIHFVITKQSIAIEPNHGGVAMGHPGQFVAVEHPALPANRYVRKLSPLRFPFLARDPFGCLVLFGEDAVPIACFAMGLQHAAVWAAPQWYWGDPKLTGRPQDPRSCAMIGSILWDLLGGSPR